MEFEEPTLKIEDLYDIVTDIVIKLESHTIQAKHYAHLDFVFEYIPLICNIFTIITLVYYLIPYTLETHIIVAISLTCVSFILFVLRIYLNYTYKAFSHMFSARQYDQVYKEINFALSKNINYVNVYDNATVQISKIEELEEQLPADLIERITENKCVSSQL